jgi:hypothetical protein
MRAIATIIKTIAIIIAIPLLVMVAIVGVFALAWAGFTLLELLV